jgi:hypothetical protein
MFDIINQSCAKVVFIDQRPEKSFFSQKFINYTAGAQSLAQANFGLNKFPNIKASYPQVHPPLI